LQTYASKVVGSQRRQGGTESENPKEGKGEVHFEVLRKRLLRRLGKNGRGKLGTGRRYWGRGEYLPRREGQGSGDLFGQGSLPEEKASKRKGRKKREGPVSKVREKKKRSEKRVMNIETRKSLLFKDLAPISNGEGKSAARTRQKERGRGKGKKRPENQRTRESGMRTTKLNVRQSGGKFVRGMGKAEGI